MMISAPLTRELTERIDNYSVHLFSQFSSEERIIMPLPKILRRSAETLSSDTLAFIARILISNHRISESREIDALLRL